MAPKEVVDPHPMQWIEVAGIAGYFANIKDTIQHGFARTQLQRFDDATEIVKTEIGVLPPFIHASCLPAALLFGQKDFTIARVEISLCGYRSAREAHLSWILERQVGGLHRHPILPLESIGGQL
jgi:alanine racemase